MTKTFDLTPNYAHMLNVMLRDAKNQAEPRAFLNSACVAKDSRADALRAVQAFLAPLNVAAQCMTTAEAVEQFREALDEMVKAIATAAVGLEYAESDPTDGKGIL